MKSGRFFFLPIFLTILVFLSAGDASALWGFGGDRGKSGLDFESGYDLNTETTLKGKAVSVESADGSGPVTITVRKGGEEIYVIAAPPWFWSDRGIAIKAADDLEITGAKAQGKDGNMYILSKKIANLTTGDAAILRSESGRPSWRGGGRAERQGGGIQRRHGGGRGR